MIDDLALQIARLTCGLKRQGADHRYIPLLVTALGFGWLNPFTVASEIGDIRTLPVAGQSWSATPTCARA